MFFADLFAALIIGAIIVFVLSAAVGTRGPWGSLFLFFIIVALFAWTGGVWLRPYGPVWYGVSWIPIVIIGLFIAILLTALSPRRYPLSARKKSQITEERKTDADVFFWILIFCLVLLAVSHFFWFPQFGWY